VLKKVDFKIPDEKWQINNIEYLVLDPTAEDYDLELVESKLLEIDELSKIGLFIRQATVTCLRNRL